jgi:hypothetical protein
MQCFAFMQVSCDFIGRAAGSEPGKLARVALTEIYAAQINKSSAFI